MLRRRFLISSVSLAAAQAFCVMDSAGLAQLERESLRGLVRRLFPTADSTIFGRAYLAAVPAEADLQVLLARILGPNDSDSLSTAIAQQIDDDFVKRDIVYLDGWLFSRTEARLCAITCLI